MEKNKMDAIIQAKVAVFASPYNTSSTKSNEWNRFLDSLTFNKLKNKKKQIDNDPLTMLARAGIPVVRKRGVE